MTEERKYRKLSHEILRLIGLCAVISLILFLILSGIATAVAETYIFQHDIPLTEFDWIDLDRWIFGVSAFLACGIFVLLFLVLLGERIAYIRKITAGINRLRDPKAEITIPLEGNNELTALAAAINEMSEVRQQLQQKEQSLAEEKEQLVRALSHDIRTPLTSILAYSDYLAQREEITPEEQRNFLHLIQNKAEQIRDLTAVLLDGAHRNPELFDNGKLLMEQIAAEFEAELDEQFSVAIDFDHCPPFSARLDVQELRRIFDNLASNARKYADPAKPVILAIGFKDSALVIRQTNTVLPRNEQTESYGIGLNSIRRIVQMYGGSVTAEESKELFCIQIILCDL